MNDKQLENLIRMACEIDEFERLATAGSRSSRVSHVDGQPDRGSADRPLVISFRRRLAGARVWRVALSTAAVAAALLLFVVRPHSDQPVPHHPRAIALSVDYCPGVALPDGLRIDRFEPTAPEYCAVLAIFRTWQNGCQCLTWHLHEWEDGRTLAEIAPGQVPDIALDVTDAPPVEQLLVVAFSPRASDLPSSDDDLHGLLDCLNDATPPTQACESAEVCAQAVEACLPPGVTVVPRSFFVE